MCAQWLIQFFLDLLTWEINWKRGNSFLWRYIWKWRRKFHYVFHLSCIWYSVLLTAEYFKSRRWGRWTRTRCRRGWRWTCDSIPSQKTETWSNRSCFTTKRKENVGREEKRNFIQLFAVHLLLIISKIILLYSIYIFKTLTAVCPYHPNHQQFNFQSFTVKLLY